MPRIFRAIGTNQPLTSQGAGVCKTEFMLAPHSGQLPHLSSCSECQSRSILPIVAIFKLTWPDIGATTFLIQCNSSCKKKRKASIQQQIENHTQKKKNSATPSIYRLKVLAFVVAGEKFTIIPNTLLKRKSEQATFSFCAFLRAATSSGPIVCSIFYRRS